MSPAPTSPATLDQDTRYPSPGRKGTSRPLTCMESIQWTQAARNWHTTRPANPDQEADNVRVRDLLVRLYEDGVALKTLADAVGWGYPQAAGILRRARQEGRGTGTRRYIAPRAPEKTPFRRDLTAAETARLGDLKAQVPTRGPGLNWKTSPARDLLAEIDRLNQDSVSLDTLGASLGVSRQAIHQHLTAYRTAQAAPGTTQE